MLARQLTTEATNNIGITKVTDESKKSLLYDLDNIDLLSCAVMQDKDDILLYFFTSWFPS